MNQILFWLAVCFLGIALLGLAWATVWLIWLQHMGRRADGLLFSGRLADKRGDYAEWRRHLEALRRLNDDADPCRSHCNPLHWFRTWNKKYL